MTARVWAMFCLIVVLIGALARPQPLAAQTRVVTQCSMNAATTGSLANVLSLVQVGDIVTFNIGADCTFSVTTTISIVMDGLTIDATTTPFKVILDGGGTTAVLTTKANAQNKLPSLTLKGLTVQNGKSANVGGGINFNGNNGLSTATLTIDRSTIMNNKAANAAGGLYNGGGTVHITNSTFTGNQATGTGTPEGGAIVNNTFGTITIANSTITNNSVNPNPTQFSFAGGIVDSNEHANTVTLTDTIVAGNQGGTCGADDLVSATNSGIGFASGGHNIIGQIQIGGPCGDDIDGGIVDGQNGDRVGTPAAPIDPLLGPLNYYGATTQTFPLLPGSLALDTGAACTAVDQRGITRPQGAGCDVGAFESGGFAFSAPSGSGQSTIVGTAFANPLTVTVTANVAGEPVDGGIVTFTGPTTNASIAPNPTISPAIPTTGPIDSGVASVAVTANTTAGTNYTVTASASGVTGAGVTYTLTNTTVPVPNAPDLQAASDSGPHNTDNITNVTTPVFDISGLISGANVQLLRNGTPIASGTAAGSTLSLTDPGPLADTTYTYTAEQTVAGTTSAASPPLTVTIDTTPPHVTINQATGQADPTATPPITFTAVFSEPVTGFSASSVQLSGTAGATTATITEIDPMDGTTFSVAITGMTTSGTVTVAIPASAVTDLAGNPNTASTSTDQTVTWQQAAHLSVSAPATAIVGTPFNVTVTVQDASNATVTAYTGTVHFTSTDGQATIASGALPADYTFVPGDHGVHTFSVTLKTAGNQTITANDVAHAAITGTSGSILVAFATASIAPAPTTTPQSAQVGTAFATPLAAIVRDTAGNPVAGVSVTFTAPASGASGTFPGGATTASATTDASGVATAPALTANAVIGTFTVTANLTSGPLATPASFSLTNTHGAVTQLTITGVQAHETVKVGQNISLTATVTFADGTTQIVTAQATWNLSNPAIATVDSNGKVTFVAPGTVTITATFMGTTGSIPVTVVPPTPLGIAPAPAPASRPGSAGTSPGGTAQPTPNPAPVPQTRP